MKVKNDFVTNSSSTCFIFVWKAENMEHPEQDLYRQIHLNQWEFDQKYEDYGEKKHRVTYMDVISAIDRYVQDPEKEDEDGFIWGPHVMPIDEVLGYLKRDKEEWERLFLKDSFQGWTDFEIVEGYRFRYNVVKRAKEKGFTHGLFINFGDSDGDVEGPGVGMAMDYAGRRIRILRDKLIVITRQDR